jgi:hypothetical protein
VAPGAQGATVGNLTFYLPALGIDTQEGTGCTTDLDCANSVLHIAGPCVLGMCNYRDTSYVFTVTSGIAVYSIPIADNVTGFDMPGAAAYDPINKLFYIAFAGGNAVVEIDPVAMRTGETSVGVTTFQ